MYIGELATFTGVTPKVIRHYEKIRVSPPPRRKGTYRALCSLYLSHKLRARETYFEITWLGV
jgi:DNA-binding transcriptional MerR regulator